jgi:hypothetical protein
MTNFRPPVASGRAAAEDRYLMSMVYRAGAQPATKKKRSREIIAWKALFMRGFAQCPIRDLNIRPIPIFLLFVAVVRFTRALRAL